MKIKVSATTEKQLDWLVAKCLGHQWRCSWMLEKEGFRSWNSYEQAWGNPTPEYSTDPAQGHPILDREKISTIWTPKSGYWTAYDCLKTTEGALDTKQDGSSILIAGLRCFVLRELGEIVEVPDELCDIITITQ